MRKYLIPFVSTLAMPITTYAADDVQLAGQDHASISLGTYGRTVSSSLRLDSSVGTGTDIDLNKVLGFGKNVQSGRLDASYRFGRRDRVELSWYRTSSGRSLSLDESITVGGVTFPEGTGVASRQQIDEVQLRWKRSTTLRKNLDLGFSFGIHAFSLDFSVNGTGGFTGDAGVKTVLPLPLIGAFGEYWFSPLWSVGGSVELLALKVGSYSGSVFDFKVQFDYRVTKRFSVGAGFASFQVKLSADSNVLDGEYKTRYSGLRVYGTYRF